MAAVIGYLGIFDAALYKQMAFFPTMCQGNTAELYHKQTNHVKDYLERTTLYFFKYRSCLLLGPVQA